MAEEGNGGTGGLDTSSASESDTVYTQIQIQSIPAEIRVGPPPTSFPVVIHSLRIETSTTTIFVDVGGYSSAPPELILIIAEEIIRAARSRLRSGAIVPITGNR